MGRPIKEVLRTMKYKVGQAVRIKDTADLRRRPGIQAEINGTYELLCNAHSNDKKDNLKYELLFENGHTVAWYDEEELEPIPNEFDLIEDKRIPAGIAILTDGKLENTILIKNIKEE